MTENEIYTAIVAGQVDEGLDRIERAVRDRRKAMADLLFDELHVGDRVRIRSGSIKPRYLIGATATVTEKRVTKVTVRFDAGIVDPYDKWAGKLCVLSPSIVERIDKERSGLALVTEIPV